MRYLNRLIWAAVAVGLSAAPSLAQVVSQTVTPGGVTQTSIGGTGGTGGAGGGGGLGGSALQGTTLATMEPAPNIAPPTGSAGGASADPIFGGYYANPYSQGLLTNAKSQSAPGGFGSALLGTTGGSSNGQFGIGSASGGTAGGAAGGRAGGTTGATGGRAGGTTGAAGGTRTGGAGGAGGFGGGGFGGGGLGGGGGLNSTDSGVVVPLQVQLTYAAVPRFQTPPLAATQLQSDLSGMLTRATTGLSNPAGVQIVTAANNDVTLRGAVKDADEARLVEGLVRLTPGVRFITNELTFPAPAQR